MVTVITPGVCQERNAEANSYPVCWGKAVLCIFPCGATVASFLMAGHATFPKLAQPLSLFPPVADRGELCQPVHTWMRVFSSVLLWTRIRCLWTSGWPFGDGLSCRYRWICSRVTYCGCDYLPSGLEESLWYHQSLWPLLLACACRQQSDFFFSFTVGHKDISVLYLRLWTVVGEFLVHDALVTCISHRGLILMKRNQRKGRVQKTS